RRCTCDADLQPARRPPQRHVRRPFRRGTLGASGECDGRRLAHDRPPEARALDVGKYSPISGPRATFRRTARHRVLAPPGYRRTRRSYCAVSYVPLIEPQGNVSENVPALRTPGVRPVTVGSTKPEVA